jgi:hypothetical protein
MSQADTPDEDGNDEREMCSAASIAMFDVLAEECGTGDQLVKEMAALMGVPDSVIKDNDSYTQGARKVLRDGPDNAETPQEVNAWVLSKAWDDYRAGEADTFRLAISEAWDAI